MPSYSNAATGKQAELLVEKQIYQQLNKLANQSFSLEELKKNFDKNGEVAALVQGKIGKYFSHSDLRALDIRYQFADGGAKNWVQEAVQGRNKLQTTEILAIWSFLECVKHDL